MYPRTNYEMSESDLKGILDACKPTPVMYLSGGAPMGGSPQENANTAWRVLGEKMGFDFMTVQPVAGKNQRFFTAVPSENETQRDERLKREVEEKATQRRAQLAAEITERQTELDSLNTH